MKEKIADLMHKKTGLPKEQILSLIEIPKDSSLGDYAFPCFTLTKTLKKSPNLIAQEIRDKIKKSSFFSKIENIKHMHFMPCFKKHRYKNFPRSFRITAD